MQATRNLATVSHEFMADMDACMDACMDAPEMIPAGGAFGGDAPAYTGHIYVKRDGYFAQSQIDAFAALFDF